MSVNVPFPYPSPICFKEVLYFNFKDTQLSHSSEALCSVTIKLSSKTYYTVSQLGAPVSSRLFLLKIKAAAEHL